MDRMMKTVVIYPVAYEDLLDFKLLDVAGKAKDVIIKFEDQSQIVKASKG